LALQQAERQRATPQAMPSKEQRDAAALGSKRRTPFDFEFGSMMRRLMHIS
jgi:hypothetical protein